MPYKIGFHTGPGGNRNGIGNNWSALDAARLPAVLMAVDDYGPCYELAAMAAASGVDHRIAFRLSTHGQNDGFDYDVPQYHMPPAAAASIQWQATMAKLPPEFDKTRVWLITENEVDKNHSDWLGRYAVEVGKLALAGGYRYAAFGFSAGEPEPAHWDTPGMLAYMRFAAEHPNEIGVALHEYNYDVSVSLESKYPYLIGRFLYLKSRCGAHGIPCPKVFIGEFGWDHDMVPNAGTAMDHLIFAADLYDNHNEVLGAAIWYLGGGFSNIADKAQRLVLPLTEMAIAWTNSPAPPPPPPPPPPQGETLNQHLWRASIDAQSISLNPEAALQKAIYQRNYVPVGSEYWTEYDGKEYAIQPAEALDGRPRLVAVAAVPDWANVYFIDEPAGDETAVLSQRDPRWAALPIGQPTGHNKTIGNYGCLLVVYNMMASYYNLTADFPDKYNERLLASAAYNGPYLKPGALAAAHPADIKSYGFKTRNDADMLPMIRQYLAAGAPVAARVDFNPATAAWDQHWVMLLDAMGDDFLIADPWTGQTGMLSQVYGIAGVDVLEAIFYKHEKIATALDTAAYFLPGAANYGQVYILSNNWGQGPERVQLQRNGNISYVVKNNQYEQRLIGDEYIDLVVDTSPGDNQFYRVDGHWLPRQMEIGQTFSRWERVTYYWKTGGCPPVGEKPITTWTTQIKLIARHDVYTIGSITLRDVIELAWLINDQEEERYYYAAGLGLVRWRKRDGKESAITELIPVGSQENNQRENLPC